MKFKLFIFVFLLLGSFNLAHADSSLYFSEIPKNLKAGDKFTAYLRLGANAESINAISGTINFPTDLIKPISLSKQGSILNLWTIEPSIKNDRISFEGVILNPGFNGSSGLLLKVNFEAKKEGSGSINFVEGKTFANDGLGTPVFTNLNKGNFTIAAKVITPKTEDPKTTIVKENSDVDLTEDNPITKVEEPAPTNELPIVVPFTPVTVEPQKTDFIDAFDKFFKSDEYKYILFLLVLFNILYLARGLKEKHYAVLDQDKLKELEIEIKQLNQLYDSLSKENNKSESKEVKKITKHKTKKVVSE